MRVSENMNVRSFLTNLADLRSRLYKSSLEVSSGKSLRDPSDDPVGAARVLRIRDQMSRIDQYYRNINQSRTFLAATDDALNSVRNLITSISEKAAYGLNGTLSQDARDAIASELDQIQGSLLHTAGTTIDGKRIFSGSEVLKEPLVLGSDGVTYTYQGDQNALSVEISEGLQIQTNVAGSDVFTAAGSDLVNTVKQLADALRADDSGAVHVLMGKVDQATQSLDVCRTRVGQSLNQLETAKAQLDQRAFNLTAEISGLEDADLAEAATSLSQNQTALQAALRTGASLQSTSLFDLIG